MADKKESALPVMWMGALYYPPDPLREAVVKAAQVVVTGPGPWSDVAFQIAMNRLEEVVEVLKQSEGT